MKRKKDDLDRFKEKALRIDPTLAEEFERSDRAIDIGLQIYGLRKKLGFTQAQLARLVGTKQSNIARIEDADYTSYTLKTLDKVAKALKASIKIKIVPAKIATVR